MFYLTSDNDDRVMYIVPQSQPVIIGRKLDNQVCNFAITDDQSISRKHASLSASENLLTLQDLGSRYGTFVNDSTDQVEINRSIQLKENDTVRFGKMNCVWNVHMVNINTCSSTLKGENLHKLKAALSKLGGVLKNEWDDSCGYLTMPAITLTIKVVLALVQGSHIVTTEFWTTFLENVNNFKAMPDPQKFLPAVVESTLNKEVVSFSPDIRRRTIFKDKQFIFFSRRQYEMYKVVLAKSGATPLLLSESKMTVSMLCEKNAVVIQFLASVAGQETQAQKNQVAEITTQLKSKGKRVIADAEIGLAILYCSTEKYCNPSFSFTSEVVKQSSDNVLKTSKVLVPESQEPNSIKIERENVKINESCESERQGLDKLTSKRKFEENEDQFNPNKKFATDSCTTNVANESNKRKLQDTSAPNPAKKLAIENDQGSSNSSEDILMDKNKSDDLFNFVNPVSNNSSNENKTKKLNLARPQKRKLNDDNDNGDLFNFVPTSNKKVNDGKSPKQSIFSTVQIKQEDTAEAPIVRRIVTVTPQDISAMRGIKLKELMENNSTVITQEFTVKEEIKDELEDRMSNLDLGNTVVIVCTNLIVKTEPTDPAEIDSLSVKNFKKFKKVWPVKKQLVLPSTMIIGDLTDSVGY